MNQTPLDAEPNTPAFEPTGTRCPLPCNLQGDQREAHPHWGTETYLIRIVFYPGESEGPERFDDSPRNVAISVQFGQDYSVAWLTLVLEN